MEQELEQKIFLLQNYINKLDMEEHIKKCIRKLKNDYPMAIVTREFYKGNGVLVRVTKTNSKTNENKKENKKENKENELDKEEIRIREKGINGLGENVDITIGKGRSREKEIGHSSGYERERGGR